MMVLIEKKCDIFFSCLIPRISIRKEVVRDVKAESALEYAAEINPKRNSTKTKEPS